MAKTFFCPILPQSHGRWDIVLPIFVTSLSLVFLFPLSFSPPSPHTNLPRMAAGVGCLICNCHLPLQVARMHRVFGTFSSRRPFTRMRLAVLQFPATGFSPRNNCSSKPRIRRKKQPQIELGMAKDMMSQHRYSSNQPTAFLRPALACRPAMTETVLICATST
ncbi:hypothetical protein VTG60DRAFT_6493 [Thermothelomyces hinnuleus]